MFPIPLCVPFKLFIVLFLPSDKDCSQAFNYLDTQTPQPVCFTYAKFLKFLRTCLMNISLDPTSYAGHSFHHGGASFAFQSGIPVEMIRLLGDWKSDAVLLYLTVPLKMCMESNNLVHEFWGHSIFDYFIVHLDIIVCLRQ